MLKRKKYMYLLIIIIVLLLPLVLYPFVIIASITSIDDFESYDYIVILGNKSKKEISSDMKERLDVFIKNNTNNSKYKIILSGGNNEAELMLEYLKDNNITQEIIIENKSTTTIQNFLYIKDMINEKSLVITNDYHILRSKLICNKLDINCDFFSVNTSKNKYIKIIKECYLIVYTFFFR